MSPQSDLQILAFATARLYRDALVEACRGVVLNWRMIGVHFLYLLGFAIIAPLVPGGLAGGFMLGLLLAVVLGNYFLTVAAAVEGERLELKEVWERGFDHFSPILTILFAFFLVELLAGALFSGEESRWLKAVVNLLLTILFNPLPEIAYQRPSMMGDMFREALEFIKENFIEWFLPAGILLGLLALFHPETALVLIISLTTVNPFRLIEQFILVVSRFEVLIGSLVILLLFLCFMYLVFTFRGLLYQKLSKSSRRKRIYQARHS